MSWHGLSESSSSEGSMSWHGLSESSSSEDFELLEGPQEPPLLWLSDLVQKPHYELRHLDSSPPALPPVSRYTEGHPVCFLCRRDSPTVPIHRVVGHTIDMQLQPLLMGSTYTRPSFLISAPADFDGGVPRQPWIELNMEGMRDRSHLFKESVPHDALPDEALRLARYRTHLHSYSELVVQESLWDYHVDLLKGFIVHRWAQERQSPMDRGRLTGFDGAVWTKAALGALLQPYTKPITCIPSVAVEARLVADRTVLSQALTRHPAERRCGVLEPYLRECSQLDVAPYDRDTEPQLWGMQQNAQAWQHHHIWCSCQTQSPSILTHMVARALAGQINDPLSAEGTVQCEMLVPHVLSLAPEGNTVPFMPNGALRELRGNGGMDALQHFQQTHTCGPQCERLGIANTWPEWVNA